MAGTLQLDCLKQVFQNIFLIDIDEILVFKLFNNLIIDGTKTQKGIY